MTLRVGDCSIQPELMQWRFGFNAGLDFSGGAPVVVSSAQQSLEGVSSIADAMARCCSPRG
ncbi:MAG: hypothetical protein IPN62_03670 [Flavobacteriales bacterium]|nr:hypothetical protein [Flavobacteriales bacterium]